MKRRERLDYALNEITKRQTLSAAQKEIIENCFVREVSVEECAALCRMRPSKIALIYTRIGMNMMQSSIDHYFS